MKAFIFPTAMAACCAAVCAQQAVAPAAQKPEIIDDPATRIILDVTRVNMLFTVTDKKGRFVTDLVGDLIDDTEKLQTAIRGLRPGGATALFDAVYFACRDKLSKDQPRHKFRRAIVIVSDGDDNQSQVTRDQALEMAQKADVVIYAISTNVVRGETDGDKILKYLTAETGGQAFFPFKVEDLEQSFENIANELRHQYNVFYRPEPLKTDGMYHTVDLKVKGRKDLVVRCRKGYYAPKL